MHKNEPKVNPTLVNYVIMVYAHKRTNSLIIQFLSWFNIQLKRINCTPIPYVNNNEKLKSVTYYILLVDSPWTDVHNLTR